MAPEMLHPDSAPSQDAALLSVRNLTAGYGKREAISDVTLHVGRGEIVSLLGHNGAGKTTLLKSLFGLLKATSGEVEFDGRACAGRSHSQNVRAGMSFTPAEAAVFPDLSVTGNLDLGAFTITDSAVRKDRLDKVLATFPLLRERQQQLAGTLSGGEQRMLSIGIALMSGPRLMLLDEPSLGLTPALAQRVLERIRELALFDGVSVLVVEQSVRVALRVSDRAYFLRTGKIILEEPAEVALSRGHWWDLF